MAGYALKYYSADNDFVFNLGELKFANVASLVLHDHSS